MITDVYHKIQTVYKRDPENNYRTLLDGQYSIPEFEYLASNEWVFTEKVDGTNVRISVLGNKLNISGKTDNSQLHVNLYNAITGLVLSEELLAMFNGDNFCLYGEGYGPKIQKGGGSYRKDNSFVLFDVRIDGWWLNRDSVEDIASKLHLDVVPILGTGTLRDMVEMTREGFKSTWGDFMAEGLVARPTTELFTRSGKRVITKIKHKDF